MNHWVVSDEEEEEEKKKEEEGEDEEKKEEEGGGGKDDDDDDDLAPVGAIRAAFAAAPLPRLGLPARRLPGKPGRMQAPTPAPRSLMLPPAAPIMKRAPPAPQTTGISPPSSSLLSGPRKGKELSSKPSEASMSSSPPLVSFEGPKRSLPAPPAGVTSSRAPHAAPVVAAAATDAGATTDADDLAPAAAPTPAGPFKLGVMWDEEQFPNGKPCRLPPSPVGPHTGRLQLRLRMGEEELDLLPTVRR
ncbi:hypothetical protein TWF481_002672 [Arthrobotrys musiformis]|uniref:Uncharacterized protein n=1 Tax=Arthrobotrys musiformis TaxID=47236 RepID=A0AAV9VR09_9PEZI